MGFRSTYLFLLSLAPASGRRRYLVPGPLCLSGLLVGLILLIGLPPLRPRLFRISGASTVRNWELSLLTLSWRFGLLLTVV